MQVAKCVPTPVPLYLTIMHIIRHPCRNPDSTARIGFRDILIQMMAPEEQLLEIPDDALNIHELAGVQGAPTEAWQSMYLELQQAYITS